MKKILLAAACLFVASQASALPLTGITMDLYNPDGSDMGYHTTVTGSIDTTAITGHLVGDLLFFGYEWTADVVWASETAGTNTWSGNAITNYSYNFNLTNGDTAVGLLCNWSETYDLPVLAVFHPQSDGSMTWVDQSWTDNNGHVGTGMQTPPFKGFFPAFSAAAGGPSAPVPEPSTMLLFGTGLVGGVAGLRRGRRRSH